MNQEALLDEQLKGMRIVTFAMIAGVLLFTGVVTLVNYSEGALVVNTAAKNIALGAVLLLSITMVFIARHRYAVMYGAITVKGGQDMQRIINYRNATLWHYLFCELPAILSALCLLVFGDYLFFIPVAMGLIEMLRKFPRRQTMAQMLGPAY